MENCCQEQDTKECCLPKKKENCCEEQDFKEPKIENCCEEQDSKEPKMGNCCEEQDTKDESNEKYKVRREIAEVIYTNPKKNFISAPPQTRGGYFPEAKKMYKTSMADDL